MTAPPAEQIDRLLDWTARLAARATDMPWAEPPEQPTMFDHRDAAEHDDFAVRFAQRLTPVTANPHLFPLRRCDGCGYRVNALGHHIQCETP